MKTLVLFFVLSLSTIFGQTSQIAVSEKVKDAEIAFLRAKLAEVTLLLQLNEQVPSLYSARTTSFQLQQAYEATKAAEAETKKQKEVKKEDKKASEHK